MIDGRLREELNALVDGELSEERASALTERLDADPDLRAEFDRLRRVADLVRGMPTARANLADEVVARLPARGRVIRPWAWVGAVVAAAAAVMVAVVMMREEPATESWTEAKEPAERTTELRRVELDKDLGEAVRDEESEEEADDAPEGARKKAESVSTALESAKESRPPAPVEKRARRGAPLDLLRLVETKGLDPKDRLTYLRMVAKLDAEKLAAHMTQVGGKSSLPGRASGTEAWSFDVTVSGPEEAAELRKVIVKAFPPPAAPAKKAQPTAVSAADAAGGVLQYGWDATPRQAGTLVAWLERIGLPALAPRGAARPGGVQIGDAKGGAKAKAASTPVRIRIRYKPR
ncbi:MAG: anti-sigma factor family protein [Planctomycetota bacterium]|jgi:hypothetical protein